MIQMADNQISVANSDKEVQQHDGIASADAPTR
jgi:hypothetical protein